MSNWLLTLIGWDPEADARKPLPKTNQPKTEKRKQERTTDLPADVQTNPVTKKPERYLQIEDGVHDWQTVNIGGQFGTNSSNLTEEEEQFFRNTKNFLLEKARILKVYWASGMSAKDASRDFTERGYSYETVKKYWTVFNRTGTSPTATERGEEE